MIFLTAVVADRTHPIDHTPYVATPLGPYHPDELAAIERGKLWLREAYNTADIRRVDAPEWVVDPSYARAKVITEVGRENREAARAEEKARNAALLACQDLTEPDEILTALGVNPADV
jgi:hypothetical protein